MVFSSFEFIFGFLPIFLICYCLVPKKFKNPVLFLGSIFFYAWGEHFLVFLLLASIMINFILSKLIYRSNKSRLYLIISLIYNFGMLIIFKYTNFIIENFNIILRIINLKIPEVNITLPLGISFYTFQIVSYIMGVYRKEHKPAPNILNLGIYVSMFPQLVAGPIVEYEEVSHDISKRKFSIQNIEDGLKIFILGLGSKVILANTMSTLWAGVSRFGYEDISCPYAWLGAFGYSFEIYFDFFGYSLMAIGLGQMLGFNIPENFNNPYISGSVSEFWRRWHITLGRWFKKNIYFPLGGSRCSKLKIIRNTFIVWAFTGLWHGASWNFIIWGLLFCILILIERFFIGDFLKKTKVLKHIYILLIIPLTWVIFALTDLNDIKIYFSRLFSFNTFRKMNDFIIAIKQYKYILIACVIFSLPFPYKLFKKYKNNPVTIIILTAVFSYSIYLLHTSDSNPFLYFRF